MAGAGVGQEHVEAFQQLAPRFEVAAICDVDPGRARAVALACQLPSAPRDFRDLCADPEIDIISICTPPHLHFRQIIQALEAGKHVVCEKPIAGSLAQIDALLEAETATGRHVMPIFQYRYGRGFQKLKRLVDLGIAGTPYLVTSETAWLRDAAYYSVPWRGKWTTELGGTLLSHAIHAIDMITYILGEPESLYSFAATRVNPIEVEDCVTAAIKLRCGALASVAVTLGSCEQISRHRFCFSGLTATSNLAPYRHSFDPWNFVGSNREAGHAITAALADFSYTHERYEGQFLAYYEALVAGAPPPVTLHDARRALECVTACYASARSAQPATLPLASTHPLYDRLQPLA